MKKLILFLFVLGTMMISVSMYLKVVNVDLSDKSFIETQNVGYSDINAGGGL